MKERLRGKSGANSYTKRIMRTWIFGAAVPLLFVELLFLGWMLSNNKREVDHEMRAELNRVSEGMGMLMDSMNTLSYMLVSDETLGDGLYDYFEDESTMEAGKLMIYIRDQIVIYEVANPCIDNITYVYIPNGTDDAVKLNQSSLFNGTLPMSELLLCRKRDVSYFGPHLSSSKAASYPCLSLMRVYKEMAYGTVYIYLESGFSYLDQIIPTQALGEDANAVLRIEGTNGNTLYSTDETLFPAYEACAELPAGYRNYEIVQDGGWKLQLWVPEVTINRQIWTLTLNLVVVILLLIVFCIVFSVLQWRSLYQPFVRFKQNLLKIAEGDDVETKIDQMNIQEFDDQVALLGELKSNILTLLDRVHEDEKKHYELEMKMVMGKMNPHFLYNTLNTLKWYASEKRDREMVHFIASLNNLLLYNMSKDKRTTLQSELDAVKAYIVLQELKYDLDFHIDSGSRPEIMQAEMPRFCLQPLVENAILHGGGSSLKLWIEVELLINGKIAILVKNEGLPLDPEKIREVLIQKKDVSTNGVGLQYVVRMMKDRFGDAFELKADRAGNINIVEIRIPFEVGNLDNGADGSAHLLRKS